jgi:hypothetical protein
MKKIIVCIAFLLSLNFGFSQDYDNGIGLRAGFASGITFKHFLNSHAAFEGIAATRWQGFEFTGLYEVHGQAFDVDRLNWYYGAGAHLGLYNGNNHNSHWANQNENYVVVGADLILGIEYNIETIPINLSLDWKPVINVLGHQGIWADGGALSVRYIF